MWSDCGPLVSNVAVTDNNLHVDRLWPTGIQCGCNTTYMWTDCGPLVSNMAVTDNNLHVDRLWPTGILALVIVAVTDDNLRVDRLWPTGISKLGLRSISQSDTALFLIKNTAPLI